jgi:hypothetical protein
MGAYASTPKKDTYVAGDVELSELCSPEYLNTGDIVLMSGNGWLARLIRCFLWTNYSHVGMLHWRVLDGDDRPTLCLWESVGHVDDLHCLLHGRKKSGVRLVRFCDKITSYIDASSWKRTQVCVVRVHPRSPEYADAIARRLCDFEHEACGTAYDSSVPDLLRAAYPTLLGANYLSTNATNDAYTCNELVAVTLVRTRICSEILPVGSITERSFINGAIGNRYQLDATLAQENIHLTVTNTPAPAYAPRTPSTHSAIVAASDIRQRGVHAYQNV